MYENRFSKWHPWQDRGDISGKTCPGVYVVAISKIDLSGKNFIWMKEIVYVGVTNSVGGLIGRLGNFDETISGRRLHHGGADRVRYKHRNYSSLKKQLFVSIAPFKCDVRSNLPADLKIMGKVVEFEYLCFAQYAQKFGKLPEFNDMKTSPKFSLKVKRRQA